MQKIALFIISTYQKYLSPIKGFKCAYGVETGITTCSAHAKKVISRYGFLKGCLLMRRQAKRCEQSYRSLQDKDVGFNEDCRSCGKKVGCYF